MIDDNNDIVISRGGNGEVPEAPGQQSRITITPGTSGARGSDPTLPNQGQTTDPTVIEEPPRRSTGGRIAIRRSTNTEDPETPAQPSTVTITPGFTELGGSDPTQPGQGQADEPTLADEPQEPVRSPITIRRNEPVRRSSGSSITITDSNQQDSPFYTGTVQSGGNVQQPVDPFHHPDIESKDILYLQEQLRNKDREIENLRAQLSSSNMEFDLEDKDSIIAELNQRIRELEENASVIPQDTEEVERLRDELRMAKITVQEIISNNKWVSLPSVTALFSLEEGDEPILSEYKDKLNALQQNGDTRLTLPEQIETLNREMEDQIVKRNNLQKTIDGLERECGDFVTEIEKLRHRFLADKRYASYYEGKNQIEGIANLRVSLGEIELELDTMLSQGIARAYGIRSTELENRLKEAKESHSSVVSQLLELVETADGIDINNIGTAFSAEEYQRHAKELLEQYELKLKEINRIVEAGIIFDDVLQSITEG